jgi:hypothetical protein
MTSFKLFGAALILSTAFATPVFAQVAGLPELPGDYAYAPWNDDFGASLPENAVTPPSAFVMAVQPPPVVVAQLTRPTLPHSAHHVSSTRAR